MFYAVDPSLKRYPERKNELLQAWDNADKLILSHLNSLDLQGKRILIVNDQFGALTCALIPLNISTYVDSYLSSQGILRNSLGKANIINQLDRLTGHYDLIILKIPKNLSFFEDILIRLGHHLRLNAQLICGVMIKHLAKSSFDLIQKYIGQTTTSLAEKKARLIFAQFQQTPVSSPYPIQVSIPPFEFPFVNHSNLFSREKLDVGTRFLLEHIPQGSFHSILDLGCANGILGIAAKKLNPHAQLIFSDESQMAIQSAKINYQKFYPDVAQFHWTNCFENQTSQSVDLVLCNPPFHQGTTVGDFIAWQMFKDSHHVLRSGGLIRIVGNIHLRYETVLKKIFGNSRIVASNNKFRIIEATK